MNKIQIRHRHTKALAKAALLKRAWHQRYGTNKVLSSSPLAKSVIHADHCFQRACFHCQALANPDMAEDGDWLAGIDMGDFG